MSCAHHREALLAAVESEDPAVAALQSKITSFQKKQKKQQRAKSDYYNWINTQRSLNDAEEAITKQILQASSNALEHIQKEKDHEDLVNSCDAQQNTISDAIKSIQDDVSVLKTAETTPQANDALSLIAEIRNAFTPTNRQDATDGEEQKRNELCADLMLDLREELSASIERLDVMYSDMSRDARAHRRKAMLLLANDQHSSNHRSLPKSLTNAFESLRVMLQNNECLEDDGEVDLLESDLKRSLDDAHSAHDTDLSQIAHENTIKSRRWDERSHAVFRKALSSNSSHSRPNRRSLQVLKKEMPEKTEQEIQRDYAEYLEFHKDKKASKQKVDRVSQEFERKRKEIETNGLKEIETLRKEFNSRSRSMKANVTNELKRKEIHLRLQALRLEREDIPNADAETQGQVIAEACKKEANRVQRMLETKQALMKLWTEQMQKSEDDRADDLRGDFAAEIQNQVHQRANRDRANYRREEITRRNSERERAEGEAVRAEEMRLERLNSLAASTPYWRSIVDKSSDIHKSTEARKNDVYVGRGDLADFQSGTLTSFTNDKVFSDANFRLGNALHEAGVARSTHARDVIRSTIPRVEARTTGIKPY